MFIQTYFSVVRVKPGLLFSTTVATTRYHNFEWVKNPIKYFVGYKCIFQPIDLLTSVFTLVKLLGPLAECYVLAVGMISFRTLID